MHVIENETLPDATLPGIEHRTLAGTAQGLAHLSVWRQAIAPGGATPPHRHDCEEVILVEAGRGKLVSGGATRTFGPDTTLVIPPNADHQIFNIGDEPLRTTAVFAMTPVAVFLPDGAPLPLPWAS
jgi:mannose-6-phosphate isomerase-like protein (cupin superfamily)